MQADRVTHKVPWIIFFSLLLAACTGKKSQPFIFSRTNPANQDANYFITDLYNPSDVKEINNIPCSTDYRVKPVWSPNGKYYACPATYGQPLIYDIHNRIKARVEPGNLNDPIYWTIMGWSPDSQYVSIFNSGSAERPYEDFSIMKYDGTGLTQLDKQANADIWLVEWSPNGKFIAYERKPVSNNHTLILIIEPSGREIARFDLSGFVQTPILVVEDLTWSPDIKKLAFHTFYNMDTDSKLYVLDIQSGNISDIIPDKSVCIFDIFGWSPDGEKIMFDAVNCREHIPEDSETVTYSINTDGSQLKPLTPKGYSTLHWTPDGKSIIMNRYPNSGIYLMDIDGKNQRKLVDNGFFVSWIKP